MKLKLSAPKPSELFLVYKNKSYHLCYVCNKLYKCSDKITSPSLHNISLILVEGFETKTKTVINNKAWECRARS